MSDLNDDLLNYELGDDIDDQALCGDEDELLLSDEELEKDVSKEEKEQIKADAEEWVNSQIQEKDSEPLKPTDNTNARNTNATELVKSETSDEKTVPSGLGSNASEASEVSSTAAGTVAAPAPQSEFSDDVSTSAECPQKTQNSFKEPMQSQQHVKTVNQSGSHSTLSSADEVSSSCNKEQEPDHSSVISCSTNAQTDSSSYIQSSQESSSYGLGQNSPIYSDPREDIEEEREERTNIKVTSERDTDYVVDNLSPEKQSNRFIPGKRGGPPAQIRPHNIRGPYHGQRPPLRFPHGNFHHMSQPFGSMATVSATLTHTSNPLIPGQFLPQQSHNPYAPHSPHGGPGPQPTQSMNSQNPMHPHQLDPMNHNIHNQRPRHPFPPYRPNAPLGFRHPNPNMFPPEYPVSGSSYNQNFGPQGSPVYRPEMQNGSVGGVGMPPNLRPAVRMQRPPLQNMPLHAMVPNYVNSPQMRLSHSSQPQNPLQMQPGSMATPTTVVPAPGQNPSSLAAPSTAIQQPGAIRPSKVLINPNFKGGVEAAKNKFIKDTQFMTTISNHVSHLQSDEELLRQQEEFINKNREHIEKRRNERKSPNAVRRSRSISRTRSRSRDRSYSPKRGNGNAAHFDRERDRDRNERLERPNGGGERYAERERDRGNGSGSGAMSRGNRFRRGNSRDRDYENRTSGNTNYAKRRRSVSPHSLHRGAVGGGNNNRRGSDREKNNVEEDEETRAYRMEIEKQKALREKILRDKEIKRRKAAEEKQYEEKRAMQPNSTNNSGSKITTEDGSQQQQQAQSQQQLQKLKPIIVTERKIISLKKSQVKTTDDIGKQKKSLPTAKIPPEAKRTIAEHLTSASNIGGSSGPNNVHSNTAIIKPVQKKELTMHTHTPPIVKQARKLSTPSDDEVELDYDEDELMLEEEDRLLATPTPSPPHTPSPEVSSRITSTSSSSSNNKSNSSVRPSGSSQRTTSSSVFTSSNRRVVLKSSSSSSSCRKDMDSNRHGSGGNGRGKNDSRKVILERVYLDTRKQMKVGSADNRRQGHRNAVKHD